MDMIKEYDHGNWMFLRLILMEIGLHVEIVNWIMVCVTTANFVVLVNVVPSSSFNASRGLW